MYFSSEFPSVQRAQIFISIRFLQAIKMRWKSSLTLVVPSRYLEKQLQLLPTGLSCEFSIRISHHTAFYGF